MLANFFPESMVGLVGSNGGTLTKLHLLAVQQKMQIKHRRDFPMVIMDRGSINIWEPQIDEITVLLNASKRLVAQLCTRTHGVEIPVVSQKFANSLGMHVDLSVPGTKLGNITADNIKPIGGNVVVGKPLIITMSKVTGIAKKSWSSNGINDYLLQVVNHQRKADGKSAIKLPCLHKMLVTREHIQGLISRIDNANPASVKRFTSEEVQFISANIIRSMSPFNCAEKTEALIQDCRKRFSCHVIKKKSLVGSLGSGFTSIVKSFAVKKAAATESDVTRTLSEHRRSLVDITNVRVDLGSGSAGASAGCVSAPKSHVAKLTLRRIKKDPDERKVR